MPQAPRCQIPCRALRGQAIGSDSVLRRPGAAPGQRPPSRGKEELARGLRGWLSHPE
jgi:hypothetical protein